MIYAQFWHNSTGYIAGTTPPQYSPAHVKPIPACGSDAVFILDGRLSRANMAAKARAICKARGFIGFNLERGPAFSRSSSCRPYEGVD